MRAMADGDDIIVGEFVLHGNSIIDSARRTGLQRMELETSSPQSVLCRNSARFRAGKPHHETHRREVVCNGPSVAVRVRSRFHDVRGRSLLRSRLWLPRLLWLLRVLQGLGVRLLWLRFKLLHTLLWI